MANSEPKPKLGRRLRLIVEHKAVMPALHWRKKAHRWFNDADGADNLMVNIGGGYFLRRGWKTLDHHSSSYPYKVSYLDYDFDLTGGEPFPFADGSVRFFYSQHALEHIPQEFCPHIFSEFQRCLRPKGAVRLTMPDFDKAYEAYRAGRSEFFGRLRRGSVARIEDGLIGMFATALLGQVPADEVREKFHSLSKEQFAEHFTARVSRESHKRNSGNHVNWWTFEKLQRTLRQAGFETVYPSAPHASRFPEMRHDGTVRGMGKLFSLDRLQGFDTADQDLSVYVEAVK